MKITKLIIALLTLTGLLLGCRHTAVESVREVDADVTATTAAEVSVQERLDKVEALLMADEVEAAQEELAPLLAMDDPPARMEQLARHINAALVAKRQAAVRDRALLEQLQAAENTELLKAASRRIEKVRILMGTGELEAAQELLAPLLVSDVFKEEVRLLAMEINERRTERALRLAQDRTASRAILQVEEGLVMPENYGATVVISREKPLLEMPAGPMEKLVRKPVTMRLQNAGIRDLIMALSEIDELNIMSDEALTEQQKITISVKDVPLQEVLSYVARNMGVAFHLGANTIWVTESLDPPGSGPKLETKIYRLHHGFIPDASGGGGGGGAQTAFGTESFSGGGGSDNELEDALAAILTESPDGATYRIFRRRNVLVVRDTRENLRVVEELLKELDRVPMQVLIEARFVTISQADLFELGFNIPEFDLDGRDPDDESAIMTFDASSTFPALTDPASGANIAVTGILGNHTYRAVLHALATKSSSRTLSAPRVTVLNNQTAEIRKGRNIYYWEEWEAEPFTRETEAGSTVTEYQTRPSGSPTELQLGITLNVNVNIGNDGKTVMLSLRPLIKDLLGFFTYGANQDPSQPAADGEVATSFQLPEVQESSVTTSVAVDSGQTVVLGGTLSSRKTNTVRKIPLLGDIPWLGVLFRTTVEQDEPEHLLMFVTAKVIGSSGEFIQYTEAEAAQTSNN